LDAKAPSIPLKEYAYNETRYRVLGQTNPVAAAQLLEAAQAAVNERWTKYEELGKRTADG
jgi:pyruvate-ferredoxin/flavodoxin oxidoreductase